MLPPVLQDVHERMPDLTRRRQLAGVVSVVPHLPAAAEQAIDRLRDADRQPLDTAAQRGQPVAFEDQVDVIALDAELDESEAFPRCSGKRRADGREEAGLSERRKIRRRPERDMDGTAGIVRGAATVRQTSPPRRRLPSCAVTSTAPRPRGRKIQLSRVTRHLEWADNTPSLLACQARRRGTDASNGVATSEP